jgi:hypothetical protein
MFSGSYWSDWGAVIAQLVGHTPTIEKPAPDCCVWNAFGARFVLTPFRRVGGGAGRLHA